MIQSKFHIRLRLLSNLIIVYMLLAFGWWSVLLFTKNRDAFSAKVERMRLLMVADGSITAQTDISTTLPYQQLQQEYRRQEYMILGEGAVFILTLLIGMYLINRSYHKEVEAAVQQRNFLLSITHELKSPIASIRLALETLNRRQLQPDKQEQLTSGALMETERLTNLVEDLLLSAKLETSYQPHFEKLNLLAVLEDTIDRIKIKYPEATFHEHFPEVLPVLNADRTGMQSVFINLIENAAKYSPKPATVEITVKQQPETVLIQIADQGLGISENEKKKIFNKFYRIGSEDTRRTKGTGLGLYIVKSIVEAHSGTIQLSDNVPNGTIFTVELPLGASETNTELVTT